MSRVSRVVRGGFWLYGTSVVNNLMGFIYWMVISAIAGSEVLGTTSAVIGFSSLIAGVLGLGVAVGLQRFLGMCLGNNNAECLRRYFWSTASFTIVTYVGVGTVLATLSLLGISVGNFKPEMLRIAGLVVSLGFVASMNSLIISSLRTDLLFIGSLSGNVLKLIVGITLVRLGFGWVGAALGYVCINLVMLVINLLYARKLVGLKPEFSINALLDVIKAGVVSWLPSIIILTGQWLGVLVIYTSVSAVETGHYYVAFTIAGFVTAIGSSMLRLLLPVLSGMRSGREYAASRVLKISLTIMAPVAVFVATYPWLPLGLLGKEYLTASTTLTVLLVGTIPLAMTACITSLVYSYGLYRYVLAIGLAQNILRIALYYLLTPTYGGLGTALAYVVGAFTGLTYSLHVARVRGFDVGLGRVLTIVSIPTVMAVTAYILKMPWPLGLVLIAASYIAYVKVGILTRPDIREVAVALLSEKTVNKLYERFRPIIDVLIP